MIFVDKAERNILKYFSGFLQNGKKKCKYMIYLEILLFVHVEILIYISLIRIFFSFEPLSRTELL